MNQMSEKFPLSQCVVIGLFQLKIKIKNKTATCTSSCFIVVLAQSFISTVPNFLPYSLVWFFPSKCRQQNSPDMLLNSLIFQIGFLPFWDFPNLL